MNANKVVAVAALALAAIVAGEAMAQFGGGFPGGMGRRGGMGGNQGGTQGGNQGGGTGSNERLISREAGPGQQQVLMEELRTDLKLTPGQQLAWNAYVEKLNAMSSDTARESRPPPSGSPQPNAMQQFDRAVDSARDRLTAVEDVAAAAKTLYAGLNDEQKSIADARLAKMLPVAGEARQQGGTPDRQTTGRRRNTQ